MGYVGCVTAACLAERGHLITGVDLDQNKVELINAGKSPIIEPGLADLISRAVVAGRLRAESNVTDLGDISIVCVGTPSNGNGSLGLTQVQRVVAHIGRVLQNASGYHVINIRSTVLPGTVGDIIIPLLEETSGRKAGVDFGVCMNPEFMRETTAIHDFDNPPFTIVGAIDDRSAATVLSLYHGIAAPIERMTLREAEMIKYVCNLFHAVKVCFANEVGNVAKTLGVDSHRVMSVFCKDTKLNLSSYYLKPGFAFGGSCLPKDLRAILHRARSEDLDVPMLSSILESNRRQIERSFELISKSGTRRVSVLGLSFKAGSDDLRESPIVILIETLIGKGYHVSVYDEEISLARLVGANRRYIDATIPHISSLLVPSADDAIDRSDVVVVSKKTPPIMEALARRNGSIHVVDLVRLSTESDKPFPAYEGLCW
jgi:GDP-mannose 6-dehydrogenase